MIVLKAIFLLVAYQMFMLHHPGSWHIGSLGKNFHVLKSFHKILVVLLSSCLTYNWIALCFCGKVSFGNCYNEDPPMAVDK